MAFSPESRQSRVGIVREALIYARHNPAYVASLFLLTTIMVQGPYILDRIYEGVEAASSYITDVTGLSRIAAENRAKMEQAETAKRQVIESERQAAANALRKDFNETAGADLLRGESNTVAVTLRDSASVAGSRIEWLTAVWDRIHRETGCDIGSTFRLEPIKGNGSPWGTQPEAYGVTLTNCPPSRVHSTQ